MAVYKLTMLLTRRGDLDPDEFADAWLALERSSLATASGLERYVFTRRIPTDSPFMHSSKSRYDAVIETWWTRKSDAADWVVSHDFEDDWLQRRMPLLAERPAAVAGEPHVLSEREPTAEDVPVAVIVLPVARRRVRADEFAAYWVDAHARFILGSPQAPQHIVRLEQTASPLAASARFTRTRFDGVGAVTFASLETLVADLASDRYPRLVADVSQVVDAEASVVFVGSPVDLT